MKHIFIFLLLIIALTACDKKYGDDSLHETTQTTSDCSQNRIDILDYFNNSNTYINDITFDKNDNLWVATSQGLLCIKTDSSFITYNTINTILSDNNILSITIDKNENIWLVINQEIYKFNPSSGNWIVYNSSNGLPSSFYCSNVYEANDSNIYTTTHSNLYKLENNQWEPIINIPNQSSINFSTYSHTFAKQDSVFWIGTHNGLLKYQNDTNYFLYTTTNSNLSDNSVWEVYVDDSGRKWMRTDSGVEMFDDENWYLFDNLIKIMIKNDIILSRYNNNYSVYTYKDNHFTPISNPCNSSISFTSFDIDKDNDVWIADRDIIYNYFKL